MARVTFTATEIQTNARINAQVKVDGRLVGSTPVTVDVPIGDHTVSFEPTQTHRSDTGTHPFKIVAGQTAAEFAGVYSKISVPPPLPPPGPPKPPAPGVKPPPPPQTGTFRCPAGDVSYNTRDELRRHIFDMIERNDPRHRGVER